MKFTITTNKNKTKGNWTRFALVMCRWVCVMLLLFLSSASLLVIDSFKCWTIWLLYKIVVCITESKANITHIWISCTLYLPIFISLGATTTITNTDEWMKKTNTKRTKMEKSAYNKIETEFLDCWQLCGVLNWKSFSLFR